MFFINEGRAGRQGPIGIIDSTDEIIRVDDRIVGATAQRLANIFPRLELGFGQFKIIIEVRLGFFQARLPSP